MTVKKKPTDSTASLKSALAQLAERREKLISHLENMVDIQSSPGNFNANPYMHGMANGLILALHTARDDDGECPYMPAPAKWLDDKYNEAASVPEMSDMDKVVMEDALIGLWMTEQANDGKTNVDLAIVEHIRTGLRLAIASR